MLALSETLPVHGCNAIPTHDLYLDLKTLSIALPRGQLGPLRPGRRGAHYRGVRRGVLPGRRAGRLGVGRCRPCGQAIRPAPSHRLWLLALQVPLSACFDSGTAQPGSIEFTVSCTYAPHSNDGTRVCIMTSDLSEIEVGQLAWAFATAIQRTSLPALPASQP